MQVTFAALADGRRLQIVELLRAGPLPVSAIAAALELQQPQTSKHLAALNAAGLVEVEAQAQLRLYRLSPQPLRELRAWIDAVSPDGQDDFGGANSGAPRPNSIDYSNSWAPPKSLNI